MKKVKAKIKPDYKKLDEFIKSSPFVVVDDWKTMRIVIIAINFEQKCSKTVAMISIKEFFVLSGMSCEILAQKSQFAEKWIEHRNEILRRMKNDKQ